MTKPYRPPASVTATVPCRVDCGGTLDIAPLALGLAPFKPATLNIALALPTTVTVRPNPGGGVKVESKGFAAAFAAADQDYTTPLGFFFLAVDESGVGDVVVTIDSGSPPRSALGGSSAALVAATAALAPFARRRMNRFQIVRLAHKLEEALFMIPCGRQDQLAAAYGGVHLWTWDSTSPRGFRARKLLKGSHYPRLEKRLLVAYPGQTHSSADINGRWVREFIKGSTRPIWREIITVTRQLAEAIVEADWAKAGRLLNRETELRLEMTPEVLTEAGRELFRAAAEHGCGARFTGAGGGGCLWALGPKTAIDELRPVWQEILTPLESAKLLPSRIDRVGLRVRIKRGS